MKPNDLVYVLPYKSDGSQFVINYLNKDVRVAGIYWDRSLWCGY